MFAHVAQHVDHEREEHRGAGVGQPAAGAGRAARPQPAREQPAAGALLRVARRALAPGPNEARPRPALFRAFLRLPLLFLGTRKQYKRNKALTNQSLKDQQTKYNKPQTKASKSLLLIKTRGTPNQQDCRASGH